MPRSPANLEPYLAALCDYHAQHRLIPSITELAGLWQIASRAWAHTLVQRLIEQNFLEQAAGRRLRPGARFFERVVADTVRAGYPDPAHDAVERTLAIDAYLIDKPSVTTLFEVRGDSMIDAGIHDGDFVVIERGSRARVGDTVLALVDNALTLKILAEDAAGRYLAAANPAYPPIRPAFGLEIHGVMCGLFRRTRRAVRRR
jgi:SOS-response transcriptional repressors (RecA-mediated autopeptidases)